MCTCALKNQPTILANGFSHHQSTRFDTYWHQYRSFLSLFQKHTVELHFLLPEISAIYSNFQHNAALYVSHSVLYTHHVVVVEKNAWNVTIHSRPLCYYVKIWPKSQNFSCFIADVKATFVVPLVPLMVPRPHLLSFQAKHVITDFSLSAPLLRIYFFESQNRIWIKYGIEYIFV